MTLGRKDSEQGNGADGFAATAGSIRDAVETLDPGVVVEAHPLEVNIAYRRDVSEVATALAGALGLLALVLAAVGIGGVVAFFVGQRTREIGIRMALGARKHNVVALVIKRTMRPVIVGAVVGIVAAAAVTRVLTGLLFGISPLDPLGMAGAVLCVLVVALVAAILPGRRAAQTAPAEALHYD